MTRRFANTQTTNTISNSTGNHNVISEPISVIKIAKSGGCVDRDETYMRQLRHTQIRAYFFGNGSGNLSIGGGGGGGAMAGGVNGISLNPHTQVMDYQYLKIFRAAGGEYNGFRFSSIIPLRYFPVSTCDCSIVYSSNTYRNDVLSVLMTSIALEESE